MSKKVRCNAIWISDVHLGTKDCKAALLCSFLKHYQTDNLFLVGDIIDGWRISTSKWYWPSEHNQVVRQVLRKSEKENTKVYYVTGNHDEFLRDYISEHSFIMGNIEVVDEAFYETAKGEKVWIVHGDDYDGVTRHHRWVAIAGDIGYNFLLRAAKTIYISICYIDISLIFPCFDFFSVRIFFIEIFNMVVQKHTKHYLY